MVKKKNKVYIFCLVLLWKYLFLCMFYNHMVCSQYAYTGDACLEQSWMKLLYRVQYRHTLKPWCKKRHILRVSSTYPSWQIHRDRKERPVLRISGKLLTNRQEILVLAGKFWRQMSGWFKVIWRHSAALCCTFNNSSHHTYSENKSVWRPMAHNIKVCV